MANEWFFQSNSSECGPYSATEMRERARAGHITAETLVRKGRDGKWVKASKVQGLLNQTEKLPKNTATVPTTPSSDAVGESDSLLTPPGDWKAGAGKTPDTSDNSTPPPLPRTSKNKCCPRCGKPTRFYNRDLRSGLCLQCRKAEADQHRLDNTFALTDNDLWKLKYLVSKTIKSAVGSEDIFELLEEKLRYSSKIKHDNERLQAAGLNQWLGGINYLAVAEISCKQKNDKTIITASVEQKPTGWFYVFLILGICFVVIGAIVPVLMYFLGKNFVIKQLERTFDECADELG